MYIALALGPIYTPSPTSLDLILTNLLQSLEILRTTHSKVLDEMEALNSDLKRVRIDTEVAEIG